MVKLSDDEEKKLWELHSKKHSKGPNPGERLDPDEERNFRELERKKCPSLDPEQEGHLDDHGQCQYTRIEKMP